MEDASDRVYVDRDMVSLSSIQVYETPERLIARSSGGDSGA